MALPLPSVWTGQHLAAGLQPRKTGHAIRSCMLKWWWTWTQVWLLSSILGSVPGGDRQTYSRVADSEHCVEMTVAELPTSHPWHCRRYQVGHMCLCLRVCFFLTMKTRFIYPKSHDNFSLLLVTMNFIFNSHASF
jgi:hypothetical protein